MIIYKHYFIAIGKGEDEASRINAFDNALMVAGISEVNLVGVSSILPEGCSELENNPGLTIGEIVHCVLARLDGVKGEAVSAGIACVLGEKDGKSYGLVMEAEGNVGGEELKKDLATRIETMCNLRRFKKHSIKIIVESIPKINKAFGSVVVAVVYR
jgi:arginine decarboxylase